MQNRVETGDSHVRVFCLGRKNLELPILLNGLDSPLELLTQRLGEEFLDGNVELLAENDRETRVDIVLHVIRQSIEASPEQGGLTILDVPRATSLLSSLS